MRRLLAAVHVQALELAACWDLTALDGITVTPELDRAIIRLTSQVDRHAGSAADTPPSLRGIRLGCVVPVRRGRGWRRHVVLHSAYVTNLLDAPEPESLGANVVAHELAHVAFHRTRRDSDTTSHGTSADCRTLVLCELALPLWDEYAACRASALIGNRFTVMSGFMSSLAAELAQNLPKPARSRRKHWHTLRAANDFVDAMIAIRAPLVTAAYLIGHIDGLGISLTVCALSTPARTSELAPYWELLRRALGSIWDSYGVAAGSKEMVTLLPVLTLAASICGADRMFSPYP